MLEILRIWPILRAIPVFFCRGDICNGELVSNLISENQPDSVVNFAADKLDNQTRYMGL